MAVKSRLAGPGPGPDQMVAVMDAEGASSWQVGFIDACCILSGHCAPSAPSCSWPQIVIPGVPTQRCRSQLECVQ